MRIVYFDIDCLRPDHLSCYGYQRPTSPTIDWLAGEGARCEGYYCASSPCLPSRTALFSGRFGVRNGVISNVGAGADFHLRTRRYVGPQPDNDMLMRRLRAGGYDTISFSNVADRHNAPWLMYGWSEFHTPNLKGGQETADEVNAAVLPWLQHNAKRDNYLLHINYWDTHRCYRMDPSWAYRFRGFPVTQEWPDEDAIRRHQGMTGRFTAQGQFEGGVSPYPLMPGAISSRRDFEHMVTGYDSAIACVDNHVSAIVDELDKQGVLEDTAIIVSSDHGDAFGEHGIYSDHVCADECIHHIPLIIRWPGKVTKGLRCSSLLYNVDLAPTLCELLGLDPLPDWDGSSFAANLRGEPGLEREYLVWDTALYTVQRAVRTRSHLMVRTYDAHGYTFAPVELYNLTSDPYQTHDVSAAQPHMVETCSAMMTDWLQQQWAKGHAIPDPLLAVLHERAVES